MSTPSDQSTQAAPVTTTSVATSTALEPLTPPEPVAAVQPEQAPALVPLDPQVQQGLDAKAAQFAQDLSSLDTHSAEFQQKLQAVYQLGNEDIKAAASVSTRLLDKPTKAMQSGLFDAKSNIGKSLIDLRHTVEDLDPSEQGLFGKKMLFGIIPFGSKIRDYFGKYQSAQ